MTAPQLTITISQTGDDLVLSGTPGEGAYGITSYSPPALQARLVYAPDSAYTHGSEATGSAWQQAVLSFSWVPDTAADEGDVAATYAAVVAAIGQFSFTVTTQISDAAAELWSGRHGSIALASGSRGYTDLAHHNPVYNVTIPVYPIPGV